MTYSNFAWQKTNHTTYKHTFGMCIKLFLLEKDKHIFLHFQNIYPVLFIRVQISTLNQPHLAFLCVFVFLQFVNPGINAEQIRVTKEPVWRGYAARFVWSADIFLGTFH